MNIPAAFGQRMLELHGQAGREWLQRLPGLIAECAGRWSLTVQPPFGLLTYNYVAPAVRADGLPVVLKVGVPNRELSTEIAALELYAGRGAVQLLAADAERGLLLLERLLPGEPLADLGSDEQATAIAAEVMQQMWRPLPAEHPFSTVADWARGMGRLRRQFGGGMGPFPAGLVERAEALFRELLDSAEEAVLLHGDLHHHNILSAGRRPWLALDPKGLAGEPAYEIGALLRNPMPWLLEQPSPGRTLARRVEQLAGLLGFERERLLGWAIAQAVLSAWWSYEDHGHGWEPAIACAEILVGLL